ncbi:hypothetical protein VE04_01414 [Pseudogymnoascus sp. 24MN13]|nr:hypothetical protein VE04_01414 [Pseudogymnoascus sp. 24MN13]
MFPAPPSQPTSQQLLPSSSARGAARAGVGLLPSRAISWSSIIVHPAEILHIVSSIARDTWNSVIVRFKVSAAEKGAYEVWYNGDNVYSSKNINVGFGDSWSDDALASGFYFKNGQYAYDIENYNDGTRTLYFDNISWYDVSDGQTDGRSVVNP